MTAQNTPHSSGPWNVHTLRAGHETLIVSADGLGVAALANKRGNFTPAEFEANARLIAAAPELLEALKRLVTTNEPSHVGHALEKARVAILKATGERP